MITREQAIQQARLDGLRPDQITEDVLVLYGYVSTNPVEGIPTTPYMTNPQVVEAMELLEKEQRDNGAAMGEEFWKAIGLVTGVVKQVVKFSVIIIALLLVSGCGAQKSERARETVQAVESNIVSYTAKRDAYDEKLIQYFRTSEHTKIQLIYEQALNSLKKPRVEIIKRTVREEVVGADGKPAYREKIVEEPVQTNVVEENAVIALGKQRLRLIQQTEMTVLQMREMLRQIEVDAANARTLLGALDAYFARRVSTLDAIAQNQKGLVDFLGQFLKNKQEAQTPAANSLPELTRGSF